MRPRRLERTLERREFLGVLGGAAAAWPFAARAQQRMPLVGFLDSGARTNMDANLAAFSSGLSDVGFTEGINVVIEYRFAEGHFDRLPALALELVRMPVTVIAATRGPAPAFAAKAATSTIPIVFQSGGDPVKDGIVTSLNRPGGNVTGATRQSIELGAKRLGLLRDLIPNATSVALLVIHVRPKVRNSVVVEGRCGTLACACILRASTEPELAAVRVCRSKTNAMLVTNDPLFIGWSDALVLASPGYTVAQRLYAVGQATSYGAALQDCFGR